MLDPAKLRKAHVIVTTYDTVRSEYLAFNPAGKNEGKAKAKAKTKASDSSDNSSEDEGAGRARAKTAKKTSPKACALFAMKWWRIVLGMSI